MVEFFFSFTYIDFFFTVQLKNWNKKCLHFTSNHKIKQIECYDNQTEHFSQSCIMSLYVIVRFAGCVQCLSGKSGTDIKKVERCTPRARKSRKDLFGLAQSFINIS